MVKKLRRSQRAMPPCRRSQHTLGTLIFAWFCRRANQSSPHSSFCFTLLRFSLSLLALGDTACHPRTSREATARPRGKKRQRKLVLAWRLHPKPDPSTDGHADATGPLQTSGLVCRSALCRWDWSSGEQYILRRLRRKPTTKVRKL
jgi:hypothetical protein